MGQVRHGSATTTHAVRAAIQRSQALLSTLSRELGINPKTVAKWRKRATVEDLKTGPKDPHSTTLTQAEEAAVVAFRQGRPCRRILIFRTAESAMRPAHPSANIWNMNAPFVHAAAIGTTDFGDLRRFSVC